MNDINDTDNAREIKLNHLYDITYFGTDMRIIWHSVSECVKIENDSNHYEDVTILDDSTRLTKWGDCQDLLTHSKYKVIEIGDKKEHPEYYL